MDVAVTGSHGFIGSALLPALIRALASPFVEPQLAVRAAEYWQIVLGPLFLLVVLFARGGINGLLGGMRRD